MSRHVPVRMINIASLIIFKRVQAKENEFALSLFSKQTRILSFHLCDCTLLTMERRMHLLICVFSCNQSKRRNEHADGHYWHADDPFACSTRTSHWYWQDRRQNVYCAVLVVCIYRRDTPVIIHQTSLVAAIESIKRKRTDSIVVYRNLAMIIRMNANDPYDC